MDDDAPPAVVRDLQTALPKTPHQVRLIPGADEVPPFDERIDFGDGISMTIAPPLDEHGRGAYVANLCAPMASMKSLRARMYAWAKERGITVVICGRISYAHNAAQEWRESAPNAAEQEAAARAALADYDELSEQARRDNEAFGPESDAPARVWCYLTHGQDQLAALIRTGHGVCLISPNFCSTFLLWLVGISGQRVGIVDHLYVEEVMGLAQMWNTKVMNRLQPMLALQTIATRYSRRVFGFCADFLMTDDDRPSIFMNWVVDDRPHYVFQVPNARPHTQVDVCLLHDVVDEEREAFGTMYRQLLACMLRHRDFRVWHSIAYEKVCTAMYLDAVKLGIRSVLLIGNADGYDKLRILTNFDKEVGDAQALFATSVVRDGINSKLKWGACVVMTGPLASGPLDHGQSSGRSVRVAPGLECKTVLWSVNAKPPEPDETLTTLRAAEKRQQAKEEAKERLGQHRRFRQKSMPKLLVDLAVRNEKAKMDVRSHCSLYTQKLVEYKPGWTLLKLTDVVLPDRLAKMTPDVVKETLGKAQPLPDNMVQTIDAAPDAVKMHLGLSQLLTLVQSLIASADLSYPQAEKEVLETCGGIFPHSHTSSTYLHGKLSDAKEVQMLRAWRIVRHFSSLGAFNAKELLKLEKSEDELNLAACHLVLGSRRVALARLVLGEREDGTSASDDKAPAVGLYTHLPDRLAALEKACEIIGVSCLAIERVELTVDQHLIVRLLQDEKMGVPSVDVDTMLKDLRPLLGIACSNARSPAYGSATLWDTLRSLLACVRSHAKVEGKRRMTADETKAWSERNDCEGGVLARATHVPGQSTADDIDELFGAKGGAEAPATAAPTTAAPTPAPGRKSKAKQTRKGAALRLPTKIVIGRKKFYFAPDGTPIDPKKATDDTREVDAVPMWRVYDGSDGTSKPASRLVGEQAPLADVDKELTSLLAGPPDERIQISEEERAEHRNAPATDVVTRLTPTIKDGVLTVEEPIPDQPFRKALSRLRNKKRRAEGRLCTPQTMTAYRTATKAEKQRMQREFDRRVRTSLGPKDTMRWQWCEAVEKDATAPDENGLRWLLVKYRVKFGIGREVASWPSAAACESKLRKEVFCIIMRDWDIVSCHFFLSEAVVVLSNKDPKEVIPTIHRYNRACEEDVRTGRGKEGNTFLKPIAEWYDVTVSEAKLGCHIVHNQGTTETWLQKELDPPREAPAEHHQDLIDLQRDARTLRAIFSDYAKQHFPPGAFDELKARLLRERPDDGSLRVRGGIERSIFGYIMQELEKKALTIAITASAACGQPAITRIYDGFGQLHVDGKDPTAFKKAAEAALLEHFKIPIYLVEKPFYKAATDDESDEEADEPLSEVTIFGETGVLEHVRGSAPRPDAVEEDPPDGGSDRGDSADDEVGNDGSDRDDSADDEEVPANGVGEAFVAGDAVVEVNGDVSDDGDGLPDDGMIIDLDERRSEDEEPNSDDNDFIATSDEDSTDSDDGGSDEDAAEGGPSVGRKRARQLLSDSDE